MNPHRLPLTFAVGKPTTLDALEAVLAIARRGGCQLASLQLRDGDDADNANQVALELIAPDPDLLALFLTRLHNLFDISDIAVCAPTVVEPLRRSA